MQIVKFSIYTIKQIQALPQSISENATFPLLQPQPKDHSLETASVNILVNNVKSLYIKSLYMIFT